MENNLSLAEQWNNLQPELIQSFGDSLYMISVSIVITVIVGLFLGIVLFLTSIHLGSTPATVKLKGIDGGPHKRRNMWFNSIYARNLTRA